VSGTRLDEDQSWPVYRSISGSIVITDELEISEQ
jgi:hypothetical protein